ncbi:hypothetical protein IRJ41_014980 [Triplophysa rosa]|uniref:Uncharacterized protein n=1 Tax=Triplophysa rosa TaxID=992332 RepID=A0A9W7WB18_TRIRA|nr:hypothetical protein IRJ41_014980 [Triplophysa rosa]
MRQKHVILLTKHCVREHRPIRKRGRFKNDRSSSTACPRYVVENSTTRLFRGSRMERDHNTIKVLPHIPD